MPLASARFPTETEAATAPDLSGANGRHSPNRGCHEVTGVKMRSCHERKSPRSRLTSRTLEFVAATYSPTWWGSTIGDGELNFSVRNGKRWILTAKTATIYVLRKNNNVCNIQIVASSLSRSCTSRLNSSLSRIDPVAFAVNLSKKSHRGRCRAISTGRL